jgi:hypothetical protein
MLWRATYERPYHTHLPTTRTAARWRCPCSYPATTAAAPAAARRPMTRTSRCLHPRRVPHGLAHRRRRSPDHQGLTYVCCRLNSAQLSYDLRTHVPLRWDGQSGFRDKRLKVPSEI